MTFEQPNPATTVANFELKTKLVYCLMFGWLIPHNIIAEHMLIYQYDSYSLFKRKFFE